MTQAKRVFTVISAAIMQLASCSSSESAVCPKELWYPSDGDACDSEGLVCEIESYGECLQNPTAESVSAVATCSKGRWDVVTMGKCTIRRPRAGTGGSRTSGTGGLGGLGGTGGRPDNDLDAGDEQDAGH